MCLIKIKNSGSFQRVKELLKLILLKKLTEQEKTTHQEQITTRKESGSGGPNHKQQEHAREVQGQLKRKSTNGRCPGHILIRMS